MQLIESFFTTLNLYLWGWPMIILLLGTHVFLTFRLRIPQRKLFTAIRLSVTKDKDSKGDISQFGALVTSLAATIGTGNIIGVATKYSEGLSVGICTFCFSTLIGWYYYGEKAMEYLTGKRFIFSYRLLNIIMCYVGGIVNLSLSLLLLHKILVKETNKYLWNGGLDKEGT